MKGTLTIIALALSAGLGPLHDVHFAKPYDFEIVVMESECMFLDGDLLFDYYHFSQLAKRGLDHQRGLIVRYTTRVPSRCVVAAVKVARRAGFRDVRKKLIEALRS